MQLLVLDLEYAGDRLVAAGERGLIAYSDDNGVSWTQAQVPVSHTLTALSFPDADNGWAVGHGGVILSTEDAGATWQQQFEGGSAIQQWLGYTTSKQAALEQVLEQADASLVPELEEQLEEILYEIEDTRIALQSGPADPFLDVLFIDDVEGWAVGAYGLLFHTNDAGLRWRLAVAGIDNAERFHYYQLAAADDDTLYLSGEAGVLYRSDDAGGRWTRLPLDYDGSLFGVLALGEDTVLCYGLRGNIFLSHDRGETWESVAPEAGAGLSLYGGAKISDEGVVLVGAGGGYLVSTDGGQTYTAQVHESRSSFAAVIEVGDRLLLGGMSGLVSAPLVVSEDKQ